jgi:hemoglobin-like flavoprotein
VIDDGLEDVLGYMAEFREDEIDSVGGLDSEIHLSADEFSHDEVQSARFPWVLAPTTFQLRDAIIQVQHSWKLITETRDVDRMVDVFYSTAAENPCVGVLFANVDMESQKKKMAGALSLVLENLHEAKGVLQTLRDMAIRHVEYGVELSHYNDIGNALIASLVDADPEIANNPTLNFSWRLAYTLIATTMMEAARPLYQQRGDLPPGLELLGGNGAFPPLFYEFNERFQNAVSGIWRKEDGHLAWQQLADVCDDFETCAQTLGRIIISEQFCKEKTIVPLQGAGGILVREI